MPQFTTIRNFIAEAISGQHTPEDIDAILDVIEQGIGLQDADRQFAEQFENIPKNDTDDPVYQRGRLQGGQDVIDLVAPILVEVEWRGRRQPGTRKHTCPNCGGAGKHDDGCGLSAIVRAITIQESEPANDNGTPVPLEQERDPSAPPSVAARIEIASALLDEGIMSPTDAEIYADLVDEAAKKEQN